MKYDQEKGGVIIACEILRAMLEGLNHISVPLNLLVRGSMKQMNKN